MQPSCELALNGAGKFKVFTPSAMPVTGARAPRATAGSSTGVFTDGSAARRHTRSSSRSSTGSPRRRDDSADSVRTVCAVPRPAPDLGTGRPSTPAPDFATTAAAVVATAQGDSSRGASDASLHESDVATRFREIRERLACAKHSVGNLRQTVGQRASGQGARPDDYSADFAGEVDVKTREVVDTEGEDEGAASVPVLNMIRSTTKVSDNNEELWGREWFKVDVKHEHEHTEVWDVQPGGTYSLLCYLNITDLRPDSAPRHMSAVEDVGIIVWVPRHDAPLARTTTAEIARATWHTSFAGHREPWAALSTGAPAGTDGVVLCKERFRVQGTPSRVVQPFVVPIPTAMLAGAERRVFRMCANVTLRRKPQPSRSDLAVCAAIAEFTVESLRKERHMDGKPLLHRTNLPPGEWK